MAAIKISKPPFSYYGGKQRMSNKIVPLLPPHTVYVEPFCGSAAVMFKKGLPEISNSHYYREVINDQNGLVINFFRVMQDKERYDALIHKLTWTVYSQDDYKLAMSICRDPDSQDAITLAWAWFVSVNWAFSNVLYGGLQYGTIGRCQPSTHYTAVERLHLYRERMKYCHVFNEDALNIIKRFDAPHTCFYVDPPYPGTEFKRAHYGSFTQQDFEALIEVLKHCKGSVVLSCYNNPAVPDAWVKHEFNSVASSSGVTGARRNTLEAPKRNADRVECVWIKPSEQMRDELYFQALINKKTMGAWTHGS